MTFFRTSFTSHEVELPFRPLLESWERGDHPAQVKLQEYRPSAREAFHRREA
jgi:hypothetical protein